MRTAQKLKVMLIAGGLLVGSVGCAADVDNWLSYLKDTQYTRYEEPEVLATNAKLELVYTRTYHGADRATTGPVNLESVSSSNPEVIRVVEFARASAPSNDLSPGRILLEAVGVGSASIHIVDGEGNELTTTVHAAKPVELRFNSKNRCFSGAQLPMVGQEVPISYELFDRQGRKLYRRNMPMAPAYTVDPPGALDGRTVVGPAGEVTLASKIDDTHLRFEVIDQGHIEEARVVVESARDEYFPGDSIVTSIRGETASGKTICRSHPLNQYAEFDVRVLTPDVCTNQTEPYQGRSYFSFESPGTCRIRFELPNARAGRGITLTPEFEVMPRRQ